MSKRDTIDKIVGSYFAAITTHPFDYDGVTYEPGPLKFGSNLLRGFICNPGCGGCCPTFTLDYLPFEDKPYHLEERTVEFNGKSVTIFSDIQKENKGLRCKNLDKDTGLCGIHGKQPFSCDFELIRFINRKGTWMVNEQLFTRGFLMKRTDGGVGALCEITPVTTESALDVARRLQRLCEWADYFGLKDHKGKGLLEYALKYSEDPTKAPRVTL